jgi:hypothetical protein
MMKKPVYLLLPLLLIFAFNNREKQGERVLHVQGGTITGL